MEPELPSTSGFETSQMLYDATSIIARQRRGQLWADKWLQHFENEEPAVVISRIAKNEMLIGFERQDYDQKYAVKVKLGVVTKQAGEMRSDPKRIFVVAPPGWGKTIITANIHYDYFWGNYNMPGIDLDSAATAEDFWHRRPVTDIIPDPQHATIATEYLAQHGMQPHGYDIIAYAPKFESEFGEEGIDKDFRLTLQLIRDIKYYKLSEAKSLLEKILALENMRTVDSMSSKAIRDDFPQHTETFGDVIGQIDKELKAQSIAQVPVAVPGAPAQQFMPIQSQDDYEYRTMAISFRRYLKSNMDEGVLANEPAPNQDLLGDMASHAGIIWRVPAPRQEGQDIATSKLQLYTNVVLTLVLNDRKRYISGTESERKRAKLKHPYGIIIRIPEVDNFVPPPKVASYTRSVIKEIGLKERKNGVNFICDTQDLSLVDPEFLGTYNMLLVGQLEESKQASGRRRNGTVDVLRAMGIAETWIDRAKAFKKTYNSLGFKVGPMLLIDRDTKIVKEIYPSLGPSAFFIH